MYCANSRASFPFTIALPAMSAVGRLIVAGVTAGFLRFSLERLAGSPVAQSVPRPMARRPVRARRQVREGERPPALACARADFHSVGRAGTWATTRCELHGHALPRWWFACS